MIHKLMRKDLVFGFLAFSLLAFGFGGLAGCATGSQSANGGTFDKESIRSVVHSRTGAYMACYEGAIDVRPGAIGKVLTTWDIGSDGGVSNVQFVEVDPTIVDIKPCLQREISALKFSPTGSNEPVEVRYPFYFDERQSMTIDRLGVVAGNGSVIRSPDGPLEVKGGASTSNLGLAGVGDTDSYTKSSNSKSATQLPPDSTGETVPARVGDIAPSTTSGLPAAPRASGAGSGSGSSGVSGKGAGAGGGSGSGFVSGSGSNNATGSSATNSGVGLTTTGERRANKSISSKPSNNPAPKPSPVVMPLPTVISPSGN